MKSLIAKTSHLLLQPRVSVFDVALAVILALLFVLVQDEFQLVCAAVAVALVRFIFITATTAVRRDDLFDVLEKTAQQIKEKRGV